MRRYGQRLTEEQKLKNLYMQRRRRAEMRARLRAQFYGVRTEEVSYDEIRQRDGDRCYLCLEFVSIHEMTFDHVVPLVKGGEHVAENIKLAHRECNSRKGKKPLAEIKSG